MVNSGGIKKKPQTNIIINEILYCDDIPKRKIADVNAVLSLVCDQLKTKFLKLNEHILSNHFNWEEIHLNKSGTMSLATKPL